MKGVWLLAAAGLLTWACGENDTPADSSSGSKTKECEDAMDCAAGETCSAGGECVRNSSGEPEGCSETVEVPWLREGNFWQVAWAEVDYHIELFESGGTADAGSYTMKLGSPVTQGEFTMYPIELIGDTDDYAPLWDHVGTDGCGNILGYAGRGPVVIYSMTNDQWTGSGFWTDFEGYQGIGVNRSASIIPSQYTKRIDLFSPPLTSVGYSMSDTGASGSGCEYFAGYGTICGSDGPGISRQTLIFEYWTKEAGPVAFHYGYDYNSGGSLATERHTERRVEVWFFGDTSDGRKAFEKEPDSYIDPMPLPIEDGVYTVFAEVNRFDTPAGAIPGVSAIVSDEVYAKIESWYPFGREDGQRVAERVHDWYEFEIVNPEERVEIYIVWDKPDHNLDLHWFAAPGHPEYGFLYLGEDYIDPGAFPEFAHAKGIPTPTVPGKYLIGVERTTDTDSGTPYGLLVLK